MSKNELDQKVPEKVAAKAEALGSINCPTYVYKDEDYPEKGPNASINCVKSSPITNKENRKSQKIYIDDDWVVFISPSGGVEKSRGVGKTEPCLVCGDDRVTQGAHFPKPRSKGGTETIPLCPTHHKLLDWGRISKNELMTIWKNEFDRFDSFDEFMDWANEKGYDYSWEEIKKKKLYEDYEEKEIRYRVKNDVEG